MEARQMGEQILVYVAAPLRTPAGEPLRPPVRLEVLLMDLSAEEDPASWLGGRREREFLRKARVVLEEPVEIEMLDEGRIREELALPAEALREIRLEGTSLVLSARVLDGKKRRSAPTRRIALALEAPPEPPAALRALTEETGIRLSWDPPKGDPPAAYNLYRREEPGAWSRRPLREVEGTDSSVLDESARYGTLYVYGLRSVRKKGPPYVESESALTTPVEYLDLYPPPVPEEVRVLEAPGGLRVVWFWGPGSPASRYRIERAPEEGPFAEVAVVEHPASDWTDETVEEGGRYRYRVVAEDDRGNRSSPSEAVLGRRLGGSAP
jgi:hypothetical protein